MSTHILFIFDQLHLCFLFFFNATMGARRDPSPRYFMHEPILCNSCDPVLFVSLTPCPPRPPRPIRPLRVHGAVV